MIFTEKKITINNNQCKIDSPVVLYRGDYNVEVRFTIVSSPYKYSNKQETNVIEQTEASYGQLVIKTPEKVVNYVKKDGNFKEEGTCTDVPKLTLQEKYKIIKEKTFNEIFEMASLNLSELCRVKQIKKDLIENTWPMDGSKERKVYWFFGETGTGKTREATKMMIKLYGENWVSLTGDLRTFFDPYNGEKGVIFDDIRKGSIVWNTLLTITDRYKTSVNVKGNRIPWLAETIIFTSPQPFTEVFTTEKNGERAAWDGLEQFTRRVYELREFK